MTFDKLFPTIDFDKADREERYWQAVKRYTLFYDNDVYRKAARQYGTNYVKLNALLDDAMFVCGSPYHHCQGINWTGDQLAFLMLFV